ncbi:hypothetical protein [uncultured Corynebacterium sp.]|uniref:hypothetical protein n=1 Tax=uncultured Corynebacterium sp. TaxID=159447 RepID=UPI00259AC73A|nr:hypothetical protein [uncultured Corynebacterium sp.]
MSNENSSTGAGEASDIGPSSARADDLYNHIGKHISFQVEGKSVEGTFEGYEESEGIETKALRVKTDGTEDDVVIVGVNSDAVILIDDDK